MQIELMRDRAEQASRLLSAMSNDKRLMILCQLVEGELSVSDLAARLGVRQSTVSQHLALLKKDGFVEARREAQQQYYSLAGDEAQRILQTLYELYCTPGRSADTDEQTRADNQR